MSAPASQTADPHEIDHIGVLGAGLIGASWASLFVAGGARVSIYDPSPHVERDVRAFIESAWPALQSLGHAQIALGDVRLSFHADPAAAAEGAVFIQESAPEKLEVKHALYRAVEPALAPNAILATSTSSFTMTELSAGLRKPSALVLGHPFNPPHLIPLVEVMGAAAASEATVAHAEAVYSRFGKTTIRLRREAIGHVANRLQAALWREAIHLVLSGVASVEDVDKAVWAGPGARWAAMGPTTLFHLGAKSGGIEAYCAHLAPVFERMWTDLGAPHLTPETVATLADGMAHLARGRSDETLGAERDAIVRAVVEAAAKARAGAA